MYFYDACIVWPKYQELFAKQLQVGAVCYLEDINDPISLQRVLHDHDL